MFWLSRSELFCSLGMMELFGSTVFKNEYSMCLSSKIFSLNRELSLSNSNSVTNLIMTCSYPHDFRVTFWRCLFSLLKLKSYLIQNKRKLIKNSQQHLHKNPLRNSKAIGKQKEIYLQIFAFDFRASNHFIERIF